MEDIYDKFWRLLRDGKIGLHKNIDIAIKELGKPVNEKDIDTPYPAKQYLWEDHTHFFSKDKYSIYMNSIRGCIVNIDICHNKEKIQGWEISPDSIEWLQKNNLLKIYQA